MSRPGRLQLYGWAWPTRALSFAPVVPGTMLPSRPVSMEGREHGARLRSFPSSAFLPSFLPSLSLIHI
eukprot:2626086-Prymnesium_polylepis.1